MRFGAFHVTGIPGARGYVVTNQSASRLTVSFSKGRLDYLVRVAAAKPARVDAVRAHVLAAVHGLYQKLQRQS